MNEIYVNSLELFRIFEGFMRIYCLKCSSVGFFSSFMFCLVKLVMVS